MYYIIWGAIIIPLAVLGLLMRRGKGLMLLAGYNTMPKEAREKIDKEMLGKEAGNLMLRMSAEFLLMAVAIGFGLGSLGVFFMAVFGVDIVVSIVRMNKQTSAASQKYNKAGMIAVLVITVVSFALVGIMFVYGDRDPIVAVEGAELRISCMFGTSIPLDDIASIELDERSAKELVPNARRTNGYGGFGDALKGNFSSKENGNFRMYVRSKSAPTIVITTNEGGLVYISMQNPGETIAIYENISD